MDQSIGIPVLIKKSEKDIFLYPFSVYNLQEIQCSVLSAEEILVYENITHRHTKVRNPKMDQLL